ncbi:MAG: FkbM family methyltransferase [Chloroflexi bacterium]|uniref:FkbM family methyltransferase n=1 Tax=Candidatus Flexifilum breve TaxID=3140694 RepID=UPI00313545CF|nr:FkbM family methyltransferase [Chloroflexota bacterium]
MREYLDDRCPVNVIAVRQAVGHVDGTLTFYKNPEHPDMGSITTVFAEQYQTTPITVEAVRFDTFVHAHQLRQMCVKVDVENAEFEFVEGASGALDAIDSLIMEVLGPAQQKRFVQRMIRSTASTPTTSTTTKWNMRPTDSLPMCIRSITGCSAGCTRRAAGEADRVKA